MGSSGKKVAIAGAGIIGLTSAALLVEDGHDVTIVARNLPGDLSTEWASPWAGALLAPHPDTGLEDLQETTLKVWQDLADNTPESGVKNIKITEYYDDRPADAKVWYASAVPNFRKLPTSELPSGVAIGYTFDGLAVNPNDYLLYLAKKLKDCGVKFIHRELHSLKQLKDLTGASIIVNASGAGSSLLAADPSVTRVRGQTMFIKCDSSLLTHAVIRQGSEYTYVIPRASDGGVILGGFRQPDNFDTAPDVSLRADILRRVNEMTGGRFAWVDLERDVARDIVGFRPGRTGGMRVEREGDVVHAYGVDGLGYVYAHGIAGRVRELVKGREVKL